MLERIPEVLPSRGVLLRHEMPDGTFHFDLMLERAGGTGAGLVSFHVDRAVDSPSTQGFGAEKIADHRGEYLDYEGDVSGGRGRVRRVASATCFICREEESRFIAVVDFGHGKRLFDASRDTRGWRFRVRPVERADTAD